MVRLFRKVVVFVKAKGFICLTSQFFFLVLSYALSVIAFPFFLILRLKILPVTYSAIGHLAVEPDIFLKQGFLGLRPIVRAILLAPANTANRHLLKYWRRYLLVIDHAWIVSLLTPLGRVRFVTYSVYQSCTAINQKAAFPEVQKQWGSRPPLLTLNDLDLKRGRAFLKSLGISDGAWFVCVHGRDDGDETSQRLHAVRNVDIFNYIPAMQEIVGRGGWVFRMGDKIMKPLPSMKNVIDYAHLNYKAEWMDVFLCGSCRFFLGSSSGLIAVANIFGVRGVLANAAAPFSICFPYGSSDVGIPKLLWSIKEQRYLTFKEIFSSPLANLRTSEDFISYNVKAIENSPDEIRDAALEMLDSLEGRLKYTKADQDRQDRMKALMNDTHYSFGAVSRVGKDFLRKYEYLL